MIFGTLSFWGCGGQGCYFQPNQRVISQMPLTQDSQTTFIPNLTWIFLSLRAKYIMSKPVGRPCIYISFKKLRLKTVIMRCWTGLYLNWFKSYDTKRSGIKISTYGGSSLVTIQTLQKRLIQWMYQLNYQLIYWFISIKSISIITLWSSLAALYIVHT